MSTRTLRGAVCALALVKLASQNGLAAEAAPRGQSEWVHSSPDGNLVYKTTDTGDRIMDFSHAGYMGGGVALPNVAVKRTLEPSGGEDDSAAIQAAIDEVAALPLENGFRGAVLLKPGVYNCPETITIAADGVVLRGSGSTGENRSTLKLTGRPHGALAIRGGDERRGRGRRNRDRAARPNEASDSSNSGESPQRPVAIETTIADAYVPSGATSFNVADAAGLVPGDWITIEKRVTPSWIEFMQMHDLVRDGRKQTWIGAGRTLETERQIAAVEGSRVTVAVPLADSIDAKHLENLPAEVRRIDPPRRVSQCGVEDLHIESPPQPFSHSRRHFSAMRISGQDCWARDVAIDETMNSVGVGGRRNTLLRVSITRHALHEGSSRPAEFAPNGSQVLLDRCSVNADNVWFVATGGGLTGPIVLLNCEFNGESRAESHQRWSTGMLYDNVRAPEGGIDFRNRGSMGSGHGWSMGWGVAWNCVARDFCIQRPPGAPNWMIGCIGASRGEPRPFGDGPDLEAGIIDSPGVPVAPESLYLAQLKERLGPDALQAIGY